MVDQVDDIDRTGKPKPRLGSVQTYLLIYNGLQFAGWLYLLLQCIHSLAFERASVFAGPTFWRSKAHILKAFQALALSEPMHVVLGFVKAPVITTMMQIFSRLFIVFAVCDMMESSHGERLLKASNGGNFPIFTFIVVFSWCVVEAVRYLFYVITLMQMDVPLLYWLRYSLFLVLYPVGIFFELFCCFIVVEFLSSNSEADTDLSMSLFTSRCYISLRCCIIAVMLSYIPGAPILFNHMLKNRKIKLKSS